VALGVSVLGERFTPSMAGAFALILGGSVLATRSGQRQAAFPEPDRQRSEASTVLRPP
jgi:drug/metabolite transporter (DMT)-like permease